VQRQLAASEDPNSITISHLNYTPLMWAVSTADRLDIVKILLDAGAEPLFYSIESKAIIQEFQKALFWRTEIELDAIRARR